MLIMRLLKASINLRWSLSFRKCSVLICNRLSWNTEKFNTNNEVASPVFLVSGSRCAGLKHIIVTYSVYTVSWATSVALRRVWNEDFRKNIPFPLSSGWQLARLLWSMSQATQWLQWTSKRYRL